MIQTNDQKTETNFQTGDKISDAARVTYISMTANTNTKIEMNKEMSWQNE